MNTAIHSGHSSRIRALYFVGLSVAAILLVAIMQVRIASAQSAAPSPSNELRVAVQTLLQADPRAANLPQKEFDQMVEALVVAAQKKGLSARDISWRPQPVSNFSQSASIGEVESCDSIICMINEAFGFSGPDMSIAMWIGICSSILVLIVGGMLEVHRRRHLAPSIKKVSDK